MSSKRDMRREDLGMKIPMSVIPFCHVLKLCLQVVPYVDLEKEKSEKENIAGTMASTLPMAAVSQHAPRCLVRVFGD